MSSEKERKEERGGKGQTGREREKDVGSKSGLDWRTKRNACRLFASSFSSPSASRESKRGTFGVKRTSRNDREIGLPAARAGEQSSCP